MEAMACLNPIGESMDYKSNFKKPKELFRGIKFFMEQGGVGHKLKQVNITKANGHFNEL